MAVKVSVLEKVNSQDEEARKTFKLARTIKELSSKTKGYRRPKKLFLITKKLKQWETLF